MKTLGASIPLRNGDDLDFCWKECILSVLPICQQVVVAESDSTDGTREALDEWAAREPKIRICHYPFTNPTGQNGYIHDWINYAREHLTTDYNIQLDADEVLDERSHGKILQRIQGPPISLTVRRYNFWRDHRTLIPFGHCCGSEVIRVAPASLWLPSDSPHPKGVQAMRLAKMNLDIEVFHYGFIRKREAFFKKERGLQKNLIGKYDPRLEEAELFDGNWMMMPGISDWIHKLQPYNGPHPKVAHEWLRERGFEP